MTHTNTDSKHGGDEMKQKIKQFEGALVETFRRRIAEYDSFSLSEMAKVSTIEVAGMGNFTNPETGKQYGFKLIIGQPDFFEDEPEDEEDEDYDDE